MPTERRLIAHPHEIAGFLAGTQTQFRRVVDPQPVSTPNVSGGLMWGHDKLGGMFAESVFPGCLAKLVACPYGEPGDRLWLAEAWCGYEGTRRGYFKADMVYWDHIANKPVGSPGEPENCRWRSPIHMPRWAARITLEVTAVRVERVQEISDSDAFADGLQAYVDTTRGRTGGDGSARYTYAAMWDKYNPLHPWKSNPWVWVCEVRKAVAGDY